MTEQCQNCKFWKEIPNATQTTPGKVLVKSGSCRRNPPSIVLQAPQGGVNIMNPQTSADWYCGEYQLNFLS